MTDLLQQMVRRSPHERAICDDRTELSWRELDLRVRGWISLLHAHGLGPSDRVAFVTGNRCTTFEALLACLHTGLVVVPVSWRLTAREIAYILADSGSRAIVVDPEYADTVRASLAHVQSVPKVRLVTGAEPLEGFLAADRPPPEVTTSEPAEACSGSVLLYTSGTTGTPKGVVSPLLRAGAPLARVARTVESLGELFGLPSDGRVLLAGPWYHSAQLFFSLFPLLRGSSLVLRQRFDAAATVADIEQERITLTHLVPTQLLRLLRLDDRIRARHDTSSLERIWHGGAPCPVEAKRRMIDWLGPVLLEYYAATEAGIATVIDSKEWLSHPGSVGRAVPPNELIILDADGNQLPRGEEGTVYLRRPADRDFIYYNAPEKTSAAYLTPGTFTVGDLGKLDDEGYLYLTGRPVDLIVSGGVNVYASEVESALLAHADVRDAAVFGVPDDDLGEHVHATVDLQPPLADLPAAESERRLDEHCRAFLAGYKVPRSYAFVPELPREPTGKLRKHELRAPYWRSR